MNQDALAKDFGPVQLALLLEVGLARYRLPKLALFGLLLLPWRPESKMQGWLESLQVGLGLHPDIPGPTDRVVSLLIRELRRSPLFGLDQVRFL